MVSVLNCVKYYYKYYYKIIRQNLCYRFEHKEVFWARNLDRITTHAAKHTEAEGATEYKESR